MAAVSALSRCSRLARRLRIPLAPPRTPLCVQLGTACRRVPAPAVGPPRQPRPGPRCARPPWTLRIRAAHSQSPRQHGVHRPHLPGSLLRVSLRASGRLLSSSLAPPILEPPTLLSPPAHTRTAVAPVAVVLAAASVRLRSPAESPSPTCSRKPYMRGLLPDHRPKHRELLRPTMMQHHHPPLLAA